MTRIAAFCLVVLCICAGLSPSLAAEAGPAPPDIFTVSTIRVDTTAESAISARDAAMAQGRPVAFTKLFRRFVTASQWGRQPQLSDIQILRMIRSFEVAGERRSTTRYLADVTYHFNPVAVRAALRQYGVAFTETRARPVLVLPIIAGTRSVDPMNPWAMVWDDPSVQQGLVPTITPLGDTQDLAALARAEPASLDWAAVAPLARRYDVAEVAVAIASEDAKSVQLIQLTAQARTASSFAYAQSTFLADAEAVMEKISEPWKTRSAVDYASRARLVAGVMFTSLEDWSKIRAQLSAIRAIEDFQVVGLALNEAEIDLTYFGRPEQLRDALAQANINLINNGGQYTLQLGGVNFANSP